MILPGSQSVFVPNNTRQSGTVLARLAEKWSEKDMKSISRHASEDTNDMESEEVFMRVCSILPNVWC